MQFEFTKNERQDQKAMRLSLLQFFRPAVISLCLGGLLLGCAKPDDIAEVGANLSAGVVYEGKLERISLVFVDQASAARFVEVAGATGELVAARRVRDTVDEFEVRSLSSALFETLTELLEDRRNSVKCQYFIRVEDEDLTRSIDPLSFDRGYAPPPTDYAAQDALEELRREISSLRQSIDITASEIVTEETPVEDSGYFEKIQEYLDLQRELVTQTLEQNQIREEEPVSKLVTVVNPCRSFSEGEDLLVISYGFEYVLEKMETTEFVAQAG